MTAVVLLERRLVQVPASRLTGVWVGVLVRV
jgi:hypothetical protein